MRKLHLNRVFVTIAAGAVLATVLTACGSSEPEAPPPPLKGTPGAPPEPVITVTPLPRDFTPPPKKDAAK